MRSPPVSAHIEQRAQGERHASETESWLALEWWASIRAKQGVVMKLSVRLRLLSRLKSPFVSSEPRPRRIPTGPLKGIVMNLSLKTQSQIYFGLFEREVHRWLRSLSTGIGTAIDIGAAYGEYTLFFLKKTPATRVYAFEPDEAVLPRLYENLKLNDLADSGRLVVSCKFVGTCNSQRELTLDSLQDSLRYPCLIKMDVDGAEAAILGGAKAINGLPRVRWLIETHSSELERDCARILTEAGFEIRIIPNAWWRMLLPEHRPSEHNRWLAAFKEE
jgi:hypothetical protein